MVCLSAIASTRNAPLPGFTDNAELWNCRVAMLSFTVLFVQEAIFGPILLPQSTASLVSNVDDSLRHDKRDKNVTHLDDSLLDFDET